MRAWRVDRPGEPSEVLTLAEVPIPEPGPGQVRVRVTAAGIGLPDLHKCRHTYPLTPSGSSLPGKFTRFGSSLAAELREGAVGRHPNACAYSMAASRSLEGRSGGLN